VIQQNRDGLGTTHHETGTLWMGTDPARSVADGTGRFHETENLYAAGPCLFPSIGSPNPMLTGIAMARLTGDRIMNPAAFVAEAGFETVFDGSALGDWRMSTIRNQPGRDDPGRFLVRRGALEARPGTDLGLLWLARPTPPRYLLRLQWMMTAPDDNSGVFVAFPDPEGQGYDNTAYVGVNFGFEVQIDELARPDNAPIHRTAAIYSFKGPTDGPLVVHPAGEWNDYEITVDGADFTVVLNGHVVNVFHFAGDPQSPQRGLPSTPAQPRFIGLQTHTGSVLFRHIRWRAL
jgi:3-keto-disaccharide hydrolase/GMC oxidoreductase